MSSTIITAIAISAGFAAAAVVGIFALAGIVLAISYAMEHLRGGENTLHGSNENGRVTLSRNLNSEEEFSDWVRLDAIPLQDIGTPGEPR